MPAKKSLSTDLKINITKYLYHWPWFVVGLILSLGLAFLYLKTTQPLYGIKATLLIKDEKKAPDQQSALHELDLVSSAQIIENEIEILKSKQLISRVVNDLKLGITYQKRNELLTQDLYKASPIRLTLLNTTGNFDQGELKVVIKDNDSFSMIMPNGKVKDFFYKDTFKNNFGNWKLEPTPALQHYRNSTITITITDPENVALKYQNLIDVSVPNKLATAVVLSINDELPQRGKDILNDLIYNYNLSAESEKNRETRSTLDFLDQRIASISGDLMEAEKGIAGFKSSRGLTDISDDSKISLQNMQANNNHLIDIDVQLSVIEGVEKYISSGQNSDKPPATVGINDPGLTSLIEKFTTLQLQRERLLATTPETNPDFDPINRQISTTKLSIKSYIKSIKSSLLNSKNKLQSFNTGFESSIKNIPTQERQYISIKRQQAIKEGLYTYLLQKREEVSVSYASTLPNEHIIDPAYIAVQGKTKKVLIYTIALLLGIGLPLMFIYIRGILKNKIITIEEIKEITEIPVICELVLQGSKKAIVINDEDSNILSEQFRTLRSKLHSLYDASKKGRVTLVTSSVSGEGKSFVSTNLGLTFAAAGKKTIILETDLRNPQIFKAVSLSSKNAGISGYLTKNLEIEDLIQKSGLNANLDLISSGSIVKNASDLLEQEKMVLLILKLRNLYDYIILDSPPLHLTSDSIILSRLADLTLYVIRQGFTDKKELDFLNELYSQNQLENVQIIFNGLNSVEFGYGYKYDKPTVKTTSIIA